VRKGYRGLVFTVVAASGIALTGCGEEASSTSSSETTDVKLAAITAVTGPFGAFGEAIKQGVDLAVKDVNKDGGVDGKDLVIEHADDASNKAEAIAQFRRFASDDSFLAVIGPNLSSNALATTPLANQFKAPMIVTGALAPWSVPFGDWVFRVGPETSTTVDALVSQAADSFDFDRVGIVHASDTDQSVASADVFRKQAKDMGYTVAADVAFQTSDTDYSAMLTQLKEADVDAVFASAVAVNAGPMLAQAKTVGLDAQWIGDGGFLNPQLIELGGEGVEGVITATTYYPGATDSKSAAFTKSYVDEYGSEPSQNSAIGYDSVMMIVDALEGLDGDADRAALRKALADVKVDGVTGTFSFPDGSGDSVRESQTLVRVAGGTFKVWDGKR
jgi:branched-chain amino acid transport system substrate-binding protein